MSSFDRRKVVGGILALLALGGCAMRPVHAPGGGADVLRGQVRLPDPTSRADFVLSRELERRLGVAGADALYRLELGLSLQSDSLPVASATQATRSSLAGQLTYRLVAIASGDVIQQGRVSGFAAYTSAGASVSSDAAARDAEERLMMTLADDLAARLVAVASGGS